MDLIKSLRLYIGKMIEESGPGMKVSGVLEITITFPFPVQKTVFRVNNFNRFLYSPGFANGQRDHQHRVRRLFAV